MHKMVHPNTWASEQTCQETGLAKLATPGRAPTQKGSMWEVEGFRGENCQWWVRTGSGITDRTQST